MFHVNINLENYLYNYINMQINIKLLAVIALLIINFSIYIHLSKSLYLMYIYCFFIDLKHNSIIKSI